MEKHLSWDARAPLKDICQRCFVTVIIVYQTAWYMGMAHKRHINFLYFLLLSDDVTLSFIASVQILGCIVVFWVATVISVIWELIPNDKIPHSVASLAPVGNCSAPITSPGWADKWGFSMALWHQEMSSKVLCTWCLHTSDFMAHGKHFVNLVILIQLLKFFWNIHFIWKL